VIRVGERGVWQALLRAARHGLRNDGQVLKLRQARWLALGGLLGRFREGGVSLAIVLAVHHEHRSFALAGLVSAVFLAGAAVTRPLHGRLIDRFASRSVLSFSSAANGLLLVAFAILVGRGMAGYGLLALAAGVGMTLPALSASLRSLWPTVAPDLNEHAYALDTVVYELTLIMAPALVGLLAGAATPAVALIALAALGVTGTAIVAAVPAAGAAAPAGRGPRSPRPRVLTQALVRLLVINLVVGCAEGSLTVLAPGAAAARGTPGVAGLLLSVMSIGSLVGALVYGALVEVATVYRRLLVCTGITTVAFLALGLAGGHIGVFATVAVVAGFAISPTITSAFIAIQGVTTRRTRTEAFAWASFCATVGAAVGQAAAGVLTAGPGLRLALWQPCIFAAAALAVALLLVRGESRQRD